MLEWREKIIKVTASATATTTTTNTTPAPVAAMTNTTRPSGLPKNPTAHTNTFK